MDQKKYEFSQNIAIFRTSRIIDIDCEELTNSEFSYLIVIHNLSKPVNSVYLSKYFGCTKVYVSKVVSKLMELDYITKTQSPKDKRAFDLDLTEKGLAVVKQYMEKYVELTSILYDKLGEEKANQLDELLKLANKILKNLKA